MTELATPLSASPGTGRKLVAMAAMGLIYFFSYFQRAAIPGPIFDQLQSDLGVSASAVTALGAVCLYVYAAMQLFVGMAADRFGGRRTLLAGGLVLCLGAILFPLARSLPLLYACRALTGLGASFMFLSIIKEIDSLWEPRHFVLFWGLISCMGSGGALAATTPLAWLTGKLGWRSATLAVGILSAVSLLVAWLTLRRMSDPPPSARRPLLAPLVNVLRNRASRPLLVVALVIFAVYFVIQITLGAKFLVDFCGLASGQASQVLMAMIVVGAIVGLLAEPIQRLSRQRRKPPILAGLTLALATSIALLWGARAGAPPAFFMISFVLLAVASGLTTPAMAATMKELNDPEVVSQSIAVTNCLSYVGVAVLSNVAGLVLDGFAGQATVTEGRTIYPGAAYAVIFGVLAAISLAALVAALLVPETRGRSRYRALWRLGVLS